MKLNITILVDNPQSWFIPYAEQLYAFLKGSHQVRFVYHQDAIEEGDILLILSCEKIVSSSALALNTNNIVVHPSDLPQGKGWSPLAWQILEGKNKIPITLFEASNEVDAGDVYLKDVITLVGTELNEEIKKLQGEKVVSMVLTYLFNRDKLKPTPQKGTESFYPQRTAAHSELDITKSIEENFNLLRVVDNERYPAFFVRKGKKYTIKITEDE